VVSKEITLFLEMLNLKKNFKEKYFCEKNDLKNNYSIF
jgi:hypothetical protein